MSLTLATTAGATLADAASAARALSLGHTIIVSEGRDRVATVVAQAGRYLMQSRLTGEHSLSIPHTDRERLIGHLSGFLSAQADACAVAPRAAVTGCLLAGGDTYREFVELPVWRQVDPASPDGDAPAWSGQSVPPAVGDRVAVEINDLGDGEVRGYFVESGFLGVLVHFDNPPNWYVKKNGRDGFGHIFGAEIASPPAPAVGMAP